MEGENSGLVQAFAKPDKSARYDGKEKRKQKI
jgi:hypothetical protein